MFVLLCDAREQQSSREQTRANKGEHKATGASAASVAATNLMCTQQSLQVVPWYI